MITWNPVTHSNGNRYESSCKRFLIYKHKSEWILVDHSGKATIGRSWIYHCDCLPSARKHAELRLNQNRE